MKTIPNLFIVGAAKAGTTSLYQYLKQHPDIYFSPVKEPNYFSTDIDIQNFSAIYRKNTFLDVDQYFSDEPLKDLQLTFIRNKEHYDKLFEGTDKYEVRGEASTSYLYSTVAAQKIYDFNPESKIIAVLRNPMERAFSHYQMALRYGHTKLGFRKAIEEDIKEKNKGWGVSELFIELGQYYNQLKRYYDIFPSDQIKVILFDDLKTDVQKVLDECFEFLNLKPIEIKSNRKYNTGRVPKYKGLNYFVTKSGIKNLIKRVTNSKYKFLRNLFFDESKEILDKSDYDFLFRIYEEDIKKTESLIHLDLSCWRNRES